MTGPINTTLQISQEIFINGWINLLQGNVYQFIGDNAPYAFEFIAPEPGRFICTACIGVTVSIEMMNDIYKEILERIPEKVLIAMRK